jgi:isoleucyl-tRNA synthetase
LDVDGTVVRLEETDVEIRAEQHEELALAQDGPHAVALDLTLDDELRAEGRAREIIRLVNDQRKTNDYALTDRIAVVLHAPEDAAEAARAHAQWIADEVLATSFEVRDASELKVELSPT